MAKIFSENQVVRCLRLTLLAFLWMGGVSLSFAASLQEDWEQDLRHNARLRISQLVRALDAPMMVREKQIQLLVDECQGENGDLAMELLIDSLSLDKLQTREAIVDVLVRTGSPQALPALIRTLHYDRMLDLRLRIMKVLPGFLLRETPRIRTEYLDQVVRDNYNLTERVLTELRRLPLRRSNQEYDSEEDHRRQIIEQALVSQLDPIATAIVGLGTRRNHLEATEVLRFFCLEPLGRNREEWAEAWKAVRLDYTSAQQQMIVSLQTMACRILADIGASPSSTLCGHLSDMVSLKRANVNVAALDATARLLENALTERQIHRAAMLMMRDESGHELEMAWRTREILAAEQLERLAPSLGLMRIDDKLEYVRRAAYRCLGASGDPEVIPRIEARLVQEKEPMALQVEMAAALGKIGGKDALRVLSLLGVYRGHYTRSEELRSEYLLFRTALESVRMIAARQAPDVSDAAFKMLLGYLEDKRPIKGSPVRAKEGAVRVQEVARFQLQLLIGREIPSFSGAEWSALWKKHGPAPATGNRP